MIVRSLMLWGLTNLQISLYYDPSHEEENLYRQTLNFNKKYRQEYALVQRCTKYDSLHKDQHWHNISISQYKT